MISIKEFTREGCVFERSINETQSMLSRTFKPDFIYMTVNAFSTPTAPTGAGWIYDIKILNVSLGTLEEHRFFCSELHGSVYGVGEVER